MLQRNEQEYSLRKKLLIGAGVVLGLSGCIVGATIYDRAFPPLTPTPLPTPTPELYSRDPGTYDYKITIDVGNYDYVECYTNKRPELTLSNDKALLKAADVYCQPDEGFLTDAGFTMDNYGITNEFMTEYDLASENLIAVASIQPPIATSMPQ